MLGKAICPKLRNTSSYRDNCTFLYKYLKRETPSLAICIAPSLSSNDICVLLSVIFASMITIDRDLEDK